MLSVFQIWGVREKRKKGIKRVETFYSGNLVMLENPVPMKGSVWIQGDKPWGPLRVEREKRQKSSIFPKNDKQEGTVQKECSDLPVMVSMVPFPKTTHSDTWLYKNLSPPPGRERSLTHIPYWKWDIEGTTTVTFSLRNHFLFLKKL